VPLPAGAIDINGNLKTVGYAASLAQADAVSNTLPVELNAIGAQVINATLPMVFNGTTWDRARSAGIGNNVAATGIPAVGGYGQFNTTPPTITPGNYTALQTSNRGEILIAKGPTGFSIDNTTFTATQATGTNLHMVCDSGCSSSAGFADNATFTIGTTAINPVGGVFDDTPPTAIATGKAASARITNNRALHTNLRNQAGTEIGTSTTPIRTDPTGTTTQPVSGTVTTTPPANASTDVTRFGGNAVATGTGHQASVFLA
jgi:hypothetical protein